MSRRVAAAGSSLAGPPAPPGPLPGERARSGALTACELGTIKSSTRKGYDYFLEQFKKWIHDEKRTDSAKHLELNLVDFFDLKLAEGRPVGECEKVMAAVVHARPGLEAAALPRVRRALRGYRKLVPAKSRYPLAECLVSGLCSVLMSMGEPSMALLVLISCYAYLRPGEARGLKVSHVVAPGFLSTSDLGVVSLILGPQEEGVQTKTCTWDDTILLDYPPWAGELLQRQVRGKSATSLVFGLEADVTLRLWKEASRRLGMTERVELYQLRHAGASADLLSRRRREPEVQTRGRWRSTSSLRRYGKPGQVQKFLNKQSEVTQGYSKWAHDHLREVMWGESRAREPPVK